MTVPETLLAEVNFFTPDDILLETPGESLLVCCGFTIPDDFDGDLLLLVAVFDNFLGVISGFLAAVDFLTPFAIPVLISAFLTPSGTGVESEVGLSKDLFLPIPSAIFFPGLSFTPCSVFFCSCSSLYSSYLKSRFSISFRSLS